MAKPEEDFCLGPNCTPKYEGDKQVGVICPIDCSACMDVVQDWERLEDEERATE